eukprot:scpid24660/ scgid20410/ 
MCAREPASSTGFRCHTIVASFHPVCLLAKSKSLWASANVFFNIPYWPSINPVPYHCSFKQPSSLTCSPIPSPPLMYPYPAVLLSHCNRHACALCSVKSALDVIVWRCSEYEHQQSSTTHMWMS